MIRRILPLCFILLLMGYVGAQDIDLTELKAPSSPAFTILGVQPTEIARPTSFDSFKASLFNDFSNDDGFTIPQNFALEFSPYWMFPHKNLTFEKLFDPNHKNVWANILSSSSISVATIDAETAIDSTITGTRMGIGYRAMIFNGSPSKKNRIKLQKALSELKQVQLEFLGIVTPLQTLATTMTFIDFDEFINAIPKEMEAYYNSKTLPESVKDGVKKKMEEEIIPFLKKANRSTPVTSQSELMQLINTKLVAEVNKIDGDTLKAKAKNIEDLIDVNGDNYKGFFLEFASAIALDFNNDRFSNARATKWSFWLTPSYRTENDKFEFLGIIRFVKNEVLANAVSDNFDIGAKLVFEKDKFSLSGEFLKRFQYVETMDNSNTLNSKNDLKAVLNIEYKLNKNILISYTFGENFNVNTENDGNLISTLGINYKIGGNTKMIKLF